MNPDRSRSRQRRPAPPAHGLRVAAVASLAVACFALTSPPAAGRGSFRLQQPWSSEPISRLPEPVRNQVTSVCRNGVARHGFAGYYPDRIVLHYEHLQCGDRPQQCGAGGCLHQVFSYEHGGWHLVKSYQGDKD